MTVAIQDTVFPYTGNGVTTTFAYGCQILIESDLVVYVDDVVATTGFTVNGIGSLTGGSVIFSSAPATGVKIRLERIVKLERTTDYQQNGDFLSRVVNPDFDRLWMALQRFEYFVGAAAGSVARVLRLGDADTNGSGAYRAQQNRIQDLADPVGEQDAANKRWTLATIAATITDGIGNALLQLLSLSTGASLIGWIQSGTGAVSRTVQNKLRETISVTDFGAKGDGTTNDAAAIQAAINAAAGGIVLVPPGSYRLSSGITIPAGTTLEGLSNGDSVNNGRAKLIGDLSVTPIVTMDGGSGSESTGIRRIYITRAAGAVPAGCIGLLVKSTDQAVIEDVVSCRSAKGIRLAGQLGISLLRCNTTQITESHWELETVVEVTAIDCRFGRNGGLDVACNEFVKIKGTEVDTVSFVRCQFNQSGVTALRAISFENYSNPNGIVTFSQCHAEGIDAFVAAPAPFSLKRLSINNCTINGNTANQLLSIPAASLNELTITGCSSLAFALTLDQHTYWRVVGNMIAGAVTINQGSGAFIGNVLNSTLTISGVMTSTVIAGNSIPSGSPFTNTASGNIAVYGNVINDSTKNNALLNKVPGRFLGLGDGVPFGIKRLTGTLNGSGNIDAAHGIATGQQAGLICQGFYKGASGEMKPLTLNYVDGTIAGFTGGTAGAKYRITLIYTDPADLDAW